MQCYRCGRPEATEADYEFIPEGEGEHLCWGGDQCNATDAETIARLRAEREGLLRLLEAVEAYRDMPFGNDVGPYLDAIDQAVTACRADVGDHVESIAAEMQAVVHTPPATLDSWCSEEWIGRISAWLDRLKGDDARQTRASMSRQSL